MPRRSVAGQQVLEYSKFLLEVSMPKGKESCRYCPCLKYDRDRDARICKMSYEVIEGPEYSMGIACPLTARMTQEEMEKIFNTYGG